MHIYIYIYKYIYILHSSICVTGILIYQDLSLLSVFEPTFFFLVNGFGGEFKVQFVKML